MSTVAARLVNRSLKAGSTRPALISRLSLSMISGGRILGRADALPTARLVSRHIIAHVGMSGNTAKRSAVVTASALARRMPPLNGRKLSCAPGHQANSIAYRQISCATEQEISERVAGKIPRRTANFWQIGGCICRRRCGRKVLHKQRFVRTKIEHSSRITPASIRPRGSACAPGRYIFRGAPTGHKSPPVPLHKR
jgi:hypothetical protein